MRPNLEPTSSRNAATTGRDWRKQHRILQYAIISALGTELVMLGLVVVEAPLLILGFLMIGCLAVTLSTINLLARHRKRPNGQRLPVAARVNDMRVYSITGPNASYERLPMATRPMPVHIVQPKDSPPSTPCTNYTCIDIPPPSYDEVTKGNEIFLEVKTLHECWWGYLGLFRLQACSVFYFDADGYLIRLKCGLFGSQSKSIKGFLVISDDFETVNIDCNFYIRASCTWYICDKSAVRLYKYTSLLSSPYTSCLAPLNKHFS